MSRQKTDTKIIKILTYDRINITSLQSLVISQVLLTLLYYFSVSQPYLLAPYLTLNKIQSPLWKKLCIRSFSSFYKIKPFERDSKHFVKSKIVVFSIRSIFHCLLWSLNIRKIKLWLGFIHMNPYRRHKNV